MRLADVQFSRSDGTVAAHVTGEIDMSNTEDLGEAFMEAVTTDLQALVLDLTEVDYVDSAGIYLIYRLIDRLQARGQRLGLVIPNDSFANDALRPAGVKLHVVAAETVDDVLRELEAGGTV